MRRRPTIVDVARVAGISKSTVSLVLQGSPLVRASTRAAVEAAMADLGYVYNRAAAHLRGAGGGLIGLVINDLRNPFFAEFATSAQMTFAASGFATVIANTDEDAALQDRVIAAMIEHGVSAFVISPAYGAAAGATFDRIARADLPAMQVLRRVDPRGDLFPFAAPDYAEGGRLAARHLIAAGARRIAFVGGLGDRAVTQERMSGYLATLDAHGLAPAAFSGRPGRAFGRDMAATLAAARPAIDAAICFSDLVALGLLAGLNRLGAAAGGGMRVVGFDDVEECALAWPALSSVHCGVAEIGRDAAAALLAWLGGGPAPPPVRRTPVRLVVRASSGSG